MKDLKLALFNIKQNFRNEKELKASFMINVIGMAINNIAFIILWYYFGKTVGEINGWNAQDIFGLYAFNTTAYGILHAFFAGTFKLPEYICSGQLDNFLTRPKNILVKVATSSVSPSAFGDLLFGIICFIIFATWSQLTIIQILISIFLLIIASIVFYSFSLICMCVSFYLLDGNNVSKGIYGVFFGTSMYHGGAFTGILRFMFTFIMPSLLIGALPVEIVKNYTVQNLLLVTVLAVFWFIVSIIFFNKSLKKYDSNNLFGFGS